MRLDSDLQISSTIGLAFFSLKITNSSANPIFSRPDSGAWSELESNFDWDSSETDSEDIDYSWMHFAIATSSFIWSLMASIRSASLILWRIYSVWYIRWLITYLVITIALSIKLRITNVKRRIATLFAKKYDLSSNSGNGAGIRYYLLSVSE